jgi:hypothetical protein
VNLAGYNSFNTTPMTSRERNVQSVTYSNNASPFNSTEKNVLTSQNHPFYNTVSAIFNSKSSSIASSGNGNHSLIQHQQQQQQQLNDDSALSMLNRTFSSLQVQSSLTTPTPPSSSQLSPSTSNFSHKLMNDGNTKHNNSNKSFPLLTSTFQASQAVNTNSLNAYNSDLLLMNEDYDNNINPSRINNDELKPLSDKQQLKSYKNHDNNSQNHSDMTTTRSSVSSLDSDSKLIGADTFYSKYLQQQQHQQVEESLFESK